MKNSVSRPRCTCCGTSETPLWRSGPQGAKSLCNACGVRYKKGKLQYLPNTNSFFLLNHGVLHNTKQSIMESSFESVPTEISRAADSEQTSSQVNVKHREPDLLRKKNKNKRATKTLYKAKSYHGLNSSSSTLLESSDASRLPDSTTNLNIEETATFTRAPYQCVAATENYSIQDTSLSRQPDKVGGTVVEKSFSAPASPVSRFHVPIAPKDCELVEDCTTLSNTKASSATCISTSSSPLQQYVKLLDCLSLGTQSRKRSLDSLEIPSTMDFSMRLSNNLSTPSFVSIAEPCVRELDTLNIRFDGGHIQSTACSVATGMNEENEQREAKDGVYSEEDFIAEVNAAILKCNGMYHLEEPKKLRNQMQRPDEDNDQKVIEKNEDALTKMVSCVREMSTYQNNVKKFYQQVKKELPMETSHCAFAMYVKGLLEGKSDKDNESKGQEYLNGCLQDIDEARKTLVFRSFSAVDVIVLDLLRLEEAEHNRPSEEESRVKSTSEQTVDVETKANGIGKQVVKSVRPTPA